MPNNDYILRSDAVSAFCGNCEGTKVCGQLGEPCEEVKRIKAIPAADVEPRQRWIPVTEKLPDVRQFVPYGPIASSKVFFKTSDKTIHLGYLTESSYVDKYDGKIVLHRWYDDHGDRIENVTKWCEPPKEETVNEITPEITMRGDRDVKTGENL